MLLGFFLFFVSFFFHLTNDFGDDYDKISRFSFTMGPSSDAMRLTDFILDFLRYHNGRLCLFPTVLAAQIVFKSLTDQSALALQMIMISA